MRLHRGQRRPARVCGRLDRVSRPDVGLHSGDVSLPATRPLPNDRLLSKRKSCVQALQVHSDKRREPEAEHANHAHVCLQNQGRSPQAALPGHSSRQAAQVSLRNSGRQERAAEEADSKEVCQSGDLVQHGEVDLKPDEMDKKTAEKVRRYILEQCKPMKVELPLRWQAFEEKLRSIAKGLGSMVMSRQECWLVAESLELDEASFDLALDHFHRVSLMFYFRTILPDTVFTDPQVLLDKVSELVEFVFELREPEENESSNNTQPEETQHQRCDRL